MFYKLTMLNGRIYNKEDSINSIHQKAIFLVYRASAILAIKEVCRQVLHDEYHVHGKSRGLPAHALAVHSFLPGQVHRISCINPLLRS